jgi:hypothetical protein
VKLRGVKKVELYDVDFVTSRGFTAYDRNYDISVEIFKLMLEGEILNPI